MTLLDGTVEVVLILKEKCLLTVTSTGSTISQHSLKKIFALFPVITSKLSESRFTPARAKLLQTNLTANSLADRLSQHSGNGNQSQIQHTVDILTMCKMG